MEGEIIFEHEGATYTSHYIVHGDDLVDYLPDGSQRTTTLRGLDPQRATLTRLRGFILRLNKA